MELEISLPCSQQHTSGHYPESDKSNPHPHTPGSLTSTLSDGEWSASYPGGFTPRKNTGIQWERSLYTHVLKYFRT
jgi:hypothetical protein